MVFQFAWPWVFLILPLPILVYFKLKPAKQEKAAVVVPFYQQLSTLHNEPQKLTLNNKTSTLLALSFIWLIFLTAAARPQWVGEAIALSISGRDLLVAVDISDSMEQTDMKRKLKPISRLEAVKDVVSEFITRREGDRIGLVLFGSNAYLQAPLTFDTKTVARFLNEAQLGFAGPQTAIGDAIGLSVKRLQQLQSTNSQRVIILLTDGANTAGEVEPLQAAKLAEQTGVKIYTVGIGADKMVVGGLFGRRTINPSAQLDEKTLVSIAQSTGGQYFRARETKELNRIYQELDKLEPIEQEKEWLRPTQALFMWPLSLALLLSVLLIGIRVRPSPSEKVINSLKEPNV